MHDALLHFIINTVIQTDQQSDRNLGQQRIYAVLHIFFFCKKDLYTWRILITVCERDKFLNKHWTGKNLRNLYSDEENNLCIYILNIRHLEGLFER